MAGPNRRGLGRVFNEVPELYDRVRPRYPDELFADLVTITRIDERSSVLEVGCGTGQATRSLAALGCSVTAIEPGADMAALARQRIANFCNVKVEASTFEEWDDRGRRFDVLVAASAWHWVDPSIGWQRAHDVLCPGGWMALLGNVVVRRAGEPEVYAETADLHERFSPGNPDWVILHSRTTCAPPTRAGDWSTIPSACSAQRSCAGTRPFSGLRGTACRSPSLDVAAPEARPRRP
jgi:SAM-dependent methyltransferase